MIVRIEADVELQGLNFFSRERIERCIQAVLEHGTVEETLNTGLENLSPGHPTPCVVRLRVLERSK